MFFNMQRVRNGFIAKIIIFFRCFEIVSTGQMYPDVPLNKSTNIQVGSCDNGPLEFTFKMGQPMVSYTLKKY